MSNHSVNMLSAVSPIQWDHPEELSLKKGLTGDDHAIVLTALPIRVWAGMKNYRPVAFLQ